uniref:Gelation factor n=1 Tax=Hirondellea gigas TaxID=1518452 RepID=A0A6A7FS79_9CRUS
MASRSWIDVQQNTFTNWANTVLKPRNVQIKDLRIDLQSGIILIHLYEMLTSKLITGFKERATMRISKVVNLTIVLNAFADDGLRLVNIGAEDLCDGNLKIILGLLWSLIQKYQIIGQQRDSDPRTPKHILLSWINDQLGGDNPKKVKNFRQAWKSGDALNNLVDSLKPGSIPKESQQSSTPLEKIENAMDVAEKELEIPRILAAKDMADGVDDLSTMTYIALFKDASEKAQNDEESKLEDESQPTPTAASVSGPGLERGIADCPSHFTLYTGSDKGGLPHDGTLDVRVNGPNGGVPVEVADKNDGTYLVTYVAEEVGEHEINVILAGEPLVEGKKILVKPKRRDSECLNVECNGIAIENGTPINELSNLTIKLTDENGDFVDNCDLSVVLKNSEDNNDNSDSGFPGKLTVTETNAGNYSVDLVCEKAGKYVIDISMNDTSKSQRLVRCFEPSKIVDSVKVECVGTAIENGLHNNEESNFLIKLTDTNGNSVDLDVEVALRSDDDKARKDVGKVKVSPIGNGQYFVDVICDESGKYILDVIVNDQPKEHYPIECVEDPSALKVKCSGPVLEKGIPSSAPAKFDIKLLDNEGNNVKKANVEVVLKDKNSGEKVGDTSVTDNGDGTYSVDVACDKVGKYDVAVLVDNEPKAHFDAECFDVTEAEMCEGVFTFEVHSRDRDGKLKSTGGEDWQVEIKGPKESVVDVETKDHGDGRYSATYTLAAIEGEEGKFKVSAKLNGKHVSSSPFTHRLSPKLSLRQKFAKFLR